MREKLPGNGKFDFRQRINYLKSHNNRIKADAEKRDGATRQVHWRRGFCGALCKNYKKHNMAILLNYVIGSLTILISLYHFRLYKIRNLNEYLKDVEPFVQRIIQTINFALAILFLLIGILTTLYSKELSAGKGLSFGFNICLLLFWSWRYIWGRLYPILQDENSKLKIVRKLIGPVLICSYSLLIILMIIE